MEFNIEEFKKKYPALWRELSQSEGIKLKLSDPLRGYTPGVVDFIQRAETKEEALEVVDYMERRGAISKSYADFLREKLLEHGPRYFGPKREPGYYLKKYYYEYNEERD